MIQVLAEHLDVKQRKNSSNVIDWFKTIDKKGIYLQKCKKKMYIPKVYPSILENK